MLYQEFAANFSQHFAGLAARHPVYADLQNVCDLALVSALIQTHGLADQIGSVDFVAREVIKAEELIDYTRRENVAERLAKRFGAAFADTAVRAMRSAPVLR